MRGRAARLVLAAACFGGAALLVHPVQAETAPGSGLFGYALRASAHGFQMTEDQPSANSHPEADVEVPHSEVSLSGGPVGYGLSSVAWPGALLGNAGSLILLVNPSAPEQVKALNDPVRAEARTGEADSEVTNDSVPGARMHAQVLPSMVTADSLLNGGGAGETVGFGRTTSVSTVTLAAAGGSSVADSTAKDLAFAAGAVTIESLTSHAQATTDGVRASAKGGTSVTGMKVAGVPVTVDESGVTVNGTHGVDPIDTATVNQALANLGMTIALSRPSKQVEGGTATYQAGSLILNWQPPGSVNVFTASLGGARVVASANARSDAVVPLPATPSPSTQQAPAATVEQPIAGGPPVATGVVPAPAEPVDPSVAAPAAAAPAEPQSLLQSADRPLLGGSAPPLAALLLTGLGALVLVNGLLRVPVAVFRTPPPVACPLEDAP